MYNWMQKQWNKHRRKMQTGEGGFTLVELVVVIAILGILGGVGTVGYSGYIKKTNIAKDIETVGNIQYALEVGAYSFSFPLADKLQVSETGTKIPVGFIVLTEGKNGENGVEVFESGSGTSYVGGTDTPCKVVETDVAYNVLTGNSWTFGSGCENTQTAYVYETKKFEYCQTHFNPSSMSTAGNIYVTTDAEAPSGADEMETSAFSTANSANVYNLSNYKLGANHKNGETIQYYSDIQLNENGSLAKVMTAAYGSDYKNTVKLRSDSWTISDMASLYTGARVMWSESEELAKKLVQWQGVGITQDTHKDSADVMINTANTVTGLNKDEFIREWEIVDNSGTSDVTFYEQTDFGLSGREYYCACRMSYNMSFASYLRTTDHPEHADRVANFGENLAVAKLPLSVCRSSLDPNVQKENNPLQDNIACGECLKKYEEYVSSGISKANADVFYGLMQTIKETGTIANDIQGMNFFQYYDRYLQEFEKLHNAVKNKTVGKSAIVITVYQEDGRLTYDVSPSTANPRLEE